MSSLPRAARASGTRLFVGYAVASLVPILVLGTVLADGSRRDGLERGLARGRAQAAVIEEMAIAPALRGRDLGDGLSVREAARLREATDLAIYRGSVVRLLLRSFDGNVVFSDNGSVEGALPASDPDFGSAASGGTEAAVVSSPQATGGRIIRVLQPVLADTSGRAVGVLELHLPFDEVAADVQASTRRTYWRLGAGLGVLYVVLALISWSTSRRLRRHAARREHESLHDPLTGLPNRKLFQTRLEDATRRQQAGAVVLVDLDRFKHVNDTLGHQAGDLLLCEVARRLRESLRTDDTVARLGGDEFGLLLPGMRKPSLVRVLLDRAQEALSAEFVIDGVPLTMDASFGVAFHPRDANDVEALLHCADAAMYHGKRSTHGTVVYHPSIAVSPSPHLSIQGDMRRAIDHDELLLDYQPVVDLVTGEVARVEALVRWQHPERGLLTPGEFLPAVEQTSLIEPMTEWVVRRALRDCARWSEAGAPWGVAVNVSARNFDDPAFGDILVGLLRGAGLGAERLQIEVTETALAVDNDAVASALHRLAGHGIGVALDDFGVGYASLAHLRTLALSEVKIDRGFVSGLGSSDQDREVVRALVQLSHGLGLSVTAEGVEGRVTATWLREAGCDHAQGYHFAPPLPWTELLGLLPAGRARGTAPRVESTP